MADGSHVRNLTPGGTPMVPGPDNPYCASHERRIESLERRQMAYERRQEEDSKLIREMHSGMGRMMEEVAAARRAAERSADETSSHLEQVRKEKAEREREAFMSLPEIDPDAPDLITGVMDRPQLVSYKHKRDSQIRELREDIRRDAEQREIERKELEARHAKAEQEKLAAEEKQAAAEEAKRRKQIQSYIAFAIAIAGAITTVVQALSK